MSYPPNNLTQSYIANEIGQYFNDPKNTNETARLLAHAALGAASAYISGQITVGAGWGSASGSASKSNIDANYASVNEQSGIIAGDKGYDVSVVNNTNLIGGIITSTGKAEDDNLNSFSTGTLSVKDIQNFSHYEGESIGISASASYSSPNPETVTSARYNVYGYVFYGDSYMGNN